MKIGIDAHNLEGHRTGVGRYLFNLLDQWKLFALPKNLSFILYFKDGVPVDTDFLPDGVFVRKLLGPVWGRLSNTLFVHRALKKAAEKDGVDILFCPGYVAPFLYKGRIALVLHDIVYQARPDLYNWHGPWDRIILKFGSKYAAQKAKVIFTPSEFSRHEVLKHFKVAKNKVLNIPLAVDESFHQINNVGAIGDFKKRYGINDKFILFVGSIFNRRHVPEMMRAFIEGISDMKQYQLLVVGADYTQPSANMSGVIDKLNKQAGREAILWKELSWSDMAVCYSAADLFIYLSDYEGFGLPVLEAMACGVPVVTSRMASIPEVAGDAVIYIDNNTNIKEIGEAIREGLTSSRLRWQMIKKGFDRTKVFSWKKCAQDTLAAVIKAADQ